MKQSDRSEIDWVQIRKETVAVRKKEVLLLLLLLIFVYCPWLSLDFWLAAAAPASRRSRCAVQYGETEKRASRASLTSGLLPRTKGAQQPILSTKKPTVLLLWLTVCSLFDMKISAYWDFWILEECWGAASRRRTHRIVDAGSCLSEKHHVTFGFLSRVSNFLIASAKVVDVDG